MKYSQFLLTCFDIVGSAEFINLDVLPVGSLTLGLNLVFGLLTFSASKNSLCNPLLYVSRANLRVRVSLLSSRVGNLQYLKASLYETGLPLTL